MIIASSTVMSYIFEYLDIIVSKYCKYLMEKREKIGDETSSPMAVE